MTMISINHLEIKRAQRVAAASLRLDRLLAIRHAQGQGCRCTPVSTEQGNAVLQFAAADTATTPLHAAALEAGTESSRIQPPASQFSLQVRLP